MRSDRGWQWRRVVRQAKRKQAPPLMQTILHRVESAMDGRDGTIFEAITSQLEDRFKIYDALIDELAIEHNRSTAELQLMQRDIHRLAALISDDPPPLRKDN